MDRRRHRPFWQSAGQPYSRSLRCEPKDSATHMVGKAKSIAYDCDRAHHGCFHPTIGFLLQAHYRRSPLYDELLHSGARNPGGNVLKDGEGVDEILARGERLPDPLERGFNDCHYLIPVIRDVNAEYNFHNRRRECAMTEVACQTSLPREITMQALTNGYAHAILKARSAVY